MDIYASDEEKGEAIKRWWRENAWSVIMVATVSVAAVVAGRYWITQQQLEALTASNLYQQMKILSEQGGVEQASAITDQLLSDYKTTGYATFSALEMAKNSFTNEESNTAQTYLEWVVNNAELAGLRDIARLRIAQIQFSNNQYDDALAQINQPEKEAFKSLFSELAGDIYLAKGELKQAKSAYQKALEGLTQAQPRQLMLQLKLDDIAGS